MPSLRDEITKSLRWLSKRQPHHKRGGLEDTWIRPGMREGKLFGQYRIVKHLGSGGMGDVYLAVDNRLGRNVALKFLPAELTSNPQILRRFQDEARTASALNHPNILTIYDIGEIEGEHFIASEYIEGVTLRDALNAGEVDLARAVQIATQVASALAEAHYAGIVHRDLKPGNIMLRSRDGYAKVIDFGLAKLLETSVESSSRDSRTIPGAVIGTVHYMSPEQARGREVDPRSDLWSLGVILYEMVARKRPYDGDTESHVIVAILDSPMPPLPDGSIAPELAAIVDRALEKDPANRYQSAEEMLLDLAQAFPGASPAITAPQRKRIRKRKTSRSLRAAAIVAAVLVLALAIWWWPLGGGDRFAAPDWLQIASSERATYDGSVELAAISPDGSYLAYVSRSNGQELLHVRPLKGNAQKPPLVADHCIGLTFSPDGQSLYYVLKDPQEEMGRVYRWKLNTGIPGLVLENVDGPVAFSPDGRQFAFLRRSEERGSSAASILVGSTSEPQDVHSVVTKVNTRIGGELAWSPAGDAIAAIVFPAQLDSPTKPSVYIFSVDGRQIGKFSPSDVRSLSYPVWLDRSHIVAVALAEGALQNHLEELHVPSGRFHAFPSELSPNSLSATRDSRTLVTVSVDRRSSIWLAPADRLDNPRPLTPRAEDIESLGWLGNDAIVFPSIRSGHVNLVRTAEDGAIQQLAKPEACVEREPANAAGDLPIVYSSNCATGGADFNIWRFNRNTGQRVQITSGSNFDNQPDLSRDGRWIVYASLPSNNPSLWRVSTAGGVPIRVSRQQGRYPFFSADGKQIVCQIREMNGSWHAAILSLPAGDVVKDLPGLPMNGSRSTPVRWSPDGAALDYVLTNAGSSNIWRQPLNGAAPRQLTAPGEDSILYFAWNPDGTKLAYVRGKADSDVMLSRRGAR